TIRKNPVSPQSAVNFSTTGHSAGDVYLLSAQVATAVTSTGAYSWSLSITETFSGSPNKNQTLSGTAYVLVSPSTNPLLIGWTLAGVDQLVSISGGVIWVYGSGGFRIFTGTSGTLTNPANDLGTLVARTATAATPTPARTSGKKSSIAPVRNQPGRSTRLDHNLHI